MDIDATLPGDPISATLKCGSQNDLINALKQAWPKITMNRYSAVHYVAAYNVDVDQIHLRVSASLREPTFKAK